MKIHPQHEALIIRTCDQVLNDKNLSDTDRAAVLFNRGFFHALKSDNERALHDYTESLRLHPEQVEVLCHRGTIYALQSAYDQALNDYKIALERRSDPQVLNNRGVILAHQGEHDAALSEYRKALELKPDNQVTLKNRYVIDQAKSGGDISSSLSSDFQLSEDVNIISSEHGDYDLTVHDFCTILKPHLAKVLNDQGIASFNARKEEQAIIDFTAAITIHSDADAFNNLGLVYANRGDYDSAIENYNSAIEQRPNYALAFNNRGTAYALKDNNQQAIDDYTRSLELSPDEAWNPYTNRGNVHRKLGNFDEAIHDYLQALTLRPEYTNAQTGLMLAHQGKTQKKKDAQE